MPPIIRLSSSTSTFTTTSSSSVVFRYNRAFSTASSHTTASTNNTIPPSLSWPDFFKYRSRLKYYGVAGGILGTLGFLSGETVLLSQPIFDPTMTILGMDPLIALGLGTLTGSFLSYTLGSALTKVFWRLTNADLARAMDSVNIKFHVLF